MTLSPTMALAVVLLAQEPAVETKFVQVAPPAPSAVVPARSFGQQRDGVLLHGLHLHPISDVNAWHAELSGWEEPNRPTLKPPGQVADGLSSGTRTDRRD